MNKKRVEKILGKSELIRMAEKHFCSESVELMVEELIDELSEGNSVRDLINRYKNSNYDLFKAFGVENGYGEIEDQTKSKWFGDEHINYFKYDRGVWVEYGYEMAERVGDNGNYILLYIYENGERYYVIFDENMKITEEEYEQLEN